MAGNTKNANAKKANAENVVCPITLNTVKEGFKVCLDTNIYESKYLAKNVFDNKQIEYPTTRQIIPVTDIIRLYKQNQSNKDYTYKIVKHVLSLSIKKQREFAERSLSEFFPNESIIDFFMKTLCSNEPYLNFIKEYREAIHKKEYVVIRLYENNDYSFAYILVRINNNYYALFIVSTMQDSKILFHGSALSEVFSTMQEDLEKNTNSSIFESIILLQETDINNQNWKDIPELDDQSIGELDGGNKIRKTKRKTKKSSQTSNYTKTKNTYKTKDGVERVIYTKEKKTYIKKKNSEGKFIYKIIKIKTPTG